MAKNMLIPLTPAHIDSKDIAYQTVEELYDVLKNAADKRINNIAITGPYGSGKSSIIKTLREDKLDSDKNIDCLFVSLATLQANDLSDSSEANFKDDEEEALNRKIEYSILQQLVYKENIEDVPNSRISRIIHYDAKTLRKRSWLGILTIIAFFIVFEPDFARVETLYELFNFGKWNVCFDLLSVIFLLFASFKTIRYIIKSYGNSKLNKLNLKNGEIQIDNDKSISTSIFNKYLDEILYFFQVTAYNVVIIEDLDRFNTHKIFLKLRELNQILNESKIVGKHITFVYAIKDDMFSDEERTKFFDYITTVIPVINPSNSKSKLKEALKRLDFDEKEIADEDLSEMGFFIQDMRILTNIVNEYKQYRDRLCAQEGQQLNYTKLLAIIVYKNYFPSDFANLHRRKGKVYTCISRKSDFIKQILESLDKEKETLDNIEKEYKATLYIKEKELRLLFLVELISKLPENYTYLQIGNSKYTIKQIADSEELFNKISSTDVVSYYYTDYYNSNGRSTKKVNLLDIEKAVNYSYRIKSLRAETPSCRARRAEISRMIIAVKSKPLKDLINEYSLEKSDLYKGIGLSPLQDIFIRQGYIGEDYYDYISYFYEGMISLADRELLLAMKQHIYKPYDIHIDKIENFVKELNDYLFDSDYILNNELLDYLVTHPEYREKYNRFILRIEREHSPLSFLAQYAQYGHQAEFVFKHFIEWNRSNVWEQIRTHADEIERAFLIATFFKYCGELNNTECEWLNNNYSFLPDHEEEIGVERCYELIMECSFVNINNSSTNLLDCVIDNSKYEISLDNLLLITRYLCGGDISITAENLNLTRIWNTNNESYKNYVNDKFSEVFVCLKDTDKDENSDCIIYILNNSNVEVERKIAYLENQKNQIGSFDEINDTEMYDVAIRTFLIEPTWSNVLKYYAYKNSLAQELVEYIKHFKESLASQKFVDETDCSFEFFHALFCSEVLDVKMYQELLPLFNYRLESPNSIVSLTSERLNILIKHNNIPFNQEMLAVINGTGSLTTYLLHYHRQFVEHLDWKYEIDCDAAMSIFSSTYFSDNEKRIFVNMFNKEVMTHTSTISDVVLSIIVKSNDYDLDDEFVLALIKHGRNERNCVKVTTYKIQASNADPNIIRDYLSALGGDYEAINDTSKKPKIGFAEYNVNLLNALKGVGYISSFKEEDKGKSLRIYHKNKS